MYFSGKGVDIDINKALEFAKRAAKDGGNQMGLTIWELVKGDHDEPLRRKPIW